MRSVENFALPDKSLSEKAKKCKGGKKSKERLTVAFFVSATGEWRKPVVIGKYANPRCLKNINKDVLPCQYLNQQKAWMTSDILHKLLSQLNSSFKAQNRSILLFLDSAGCHPYDLKGRYSNIKLVFPVNCTSKLQPLDLGIIQNFKVHYRKLLLRHVITMTTDHNCATDVAKTLDVLQAIRWMETAWSKVENDTIIKCFAASGISSTFSEAAIVSIVSTILSNRLHPEVESVLTWSPITNVQPVTVFLPSNSCWRPLVLLTSWK